VIRFDSDYQTIMRRVGATHGVEVVEGSAAVQPEQYIDVCHFNATGHAAVAAVLAPTLAKVLRLQSASQRRGIGRRPRGAAGSNGS
jgi:hypothetical protein